MHAWNIIQIDLQCIQQQTLQRYMSQTLRLIILTLKTRWHTSQSHSHFDRTCTPVITKWNKQHTDYTDLTQSAWRYTCKYNDWWTRDDYFIYFEWFIPTSTPNGMTGIEKRDETMWKLGHLPYITTPAFGTSTIFLQSYLACIPLSDNSIPCVKSWLTD